MKFVHMSVLLYIYGPMSLQDCCIKPKLIPERIEDKCALQRNNVTYSYQIQELDAPCYYECLANGSDIFENNELNRNKVIHFITERIGEHRGWDDVIEKSVDFCLNKITLWKNHQDSAGWSHIWESRTDDSNRQKCDPSGGVLFSCLDSELASKCPKEAWDRSQQCQLILGHLTNRSTQNDD